MKECRCLRCSANPEGIEIRAVHETVRATTADTSRYRENAGSDRGRNESPGGSPGSADTDHFEVRPFENRGCNEDREIASR